MAIQKLDSKSRVMVVGTSGAGKSTFALRLSAKLRTKDIELDALFWEPEWTQTPPQLFREKIERATAGDEGWVMHGNYNKVRDLTWRKATTLVWLDYPLSLVFWRVLKRSIKRILTREVLWSGNRETSSKTFFSKDSILLWSLQTYEIRKQQYEDLIKDPEYSHLTIHRFKNPSDAEEFLRLIS